MERTSIRLAIAVAEIDKEYNTPQNRLWRILDFYVSKEMSVPSETGARKLYLPIKIKLELMN